MHDFVPARPGAMLLLGSWLPDLAPGPKLKASDWIEANICLGGENNAQPGPLKLFKYQRDMIDLITVPGVRVAALQLAAQVGKSLSIDALVTWLVANEPGPMLAVHPTDEMAEGFMQDRLDVMVGASPALAGLFGTGGRGRSAGNSKKRKIFAGGILYTGSAHRPESLRGKSIRYVLLDEVDGFRLSAGQEGDVVDLALKRMHNYDDTLAIMASTTTNFTSRINPWFKRGTQHRFFCECPNCGEWDYYRGEQLDYKSTAFDKARLLCLKCGHATTERERRAALQDGEWRPTNPDAEPGVVSFHASVFISEAPKATLALIAQSAEAAKISPEKKRAYVNTSLGEVHEEEGFQVEPDDLRARAITIASPYPAAIFYLTAGVDVQGNRLEIQIQGHGAANTTYIMQHRILRGDTTSDAPWTALAKVLDSSFDMKDGRSLPIAYTYVDSGDQTSMVYGRVDELRAPGRSVSAIKGNKSQKVNVLASKAPTYGAGTLLTVGTDRMKERVYRSITLEDGAPYKIYTPSHLDSEFYDGLCSEQIMTEYVRGFPVQSFHKIRGRNEPLDCCVYALAATESVSAEVKSGQSGKVLWPTFNKILNRG